MAAFNWIRFEALCPACGRGALIRAQTHVASSYGGDANGRFHDRTFALGERMPWLDVASDQYAGEWPFSETPGDAHEACYSRCEECSAALFAVLVFEDFRPVRIESLGLEEDWPAEHPR